MDEKNIEKYFDKKFQELGNKLSPDETIGKIQTDIKKIQTDILPMVEWFNHMNWLKTTVLYLAGAVVAISSAIMAIKSFLSK